MIAPPECGSRSRLTRRNIITMNNPPSYTCAFTGHRPQKLPWKYNETDSRCLALKTALSQQIMKLVGEGVTDFFSGMAEGTDTYCAQIVGFALVKNHL